MRPRLLARISLLKTKADEETRSVSHSLSRSPLYSLLLAPVGPTVRGNMITALRLQPPAVCYRPIDRRQSYAGEKKEECPSSAAEKKDALSTPRKVLFAHVALFLIKGPGIGVGTVVVKMGLAHVNPIVFAFLRNAISAFLLLPLSLIIDRKVTVHRRHVGSILGGGVLLFVTNSFYTLGLKLSSPVIGGAWQCMTPIFASAWAIYLGRESFGWKKGAGLILAIGGALTMVLLEPSSDSSDHGSVMAGCLCFFVNTNAYALYFVTNKPLREFYPALCLTAWSFSICSLLLLVMIEVAAAVPVIHKLIFHDCVDDWNVPNTAMFALAWMVLFYSIGQYSIFNWANSFMDISKITAHLTWVPLFAALATFVFLESGWSHPDIDLTMPSYNALGAIGIILGLAVVLWDDVMKRTAAELPVKPQNAQAARRKTDMYL